MAKPKEKEGPRHPVTGEDLGEVASDFYKMIPDELKEMPDAEKSAKIVRFLDYAGTMEGQAEKRDQTDLGRKRLASKVFRYIREQFHDKGINLRGFSEHAVPKGMDPTEYKKMFREYMQEALHEVVAEAVEMGYGSSKIAEEIFPEVQVRKAKAKGIDAKISDFSSMDEHLRKQQQQEYVKNVTGGDYIQALRAFGSTEDIISALNDSNSQVYKLLDKTASLASGQQRKVDALIGVIQDEHGNNPDYIPNNLVDATNRFHAKSDYSIDPSHVREPQAYLEAQELLQQQPHNLARLAKSEGTKHKLKPKAANDNAKPKYDAA